MRRHVSSLAVAASMVVACNIAGFGGEDVAPETGLPERTLLTCDAKKLSAQDPSGLPTCACATGGVARCLPRAELSPNLSKQLDGCDGDRGACVPDDLVKSGGVPKRCRSQLGDGRCMSLCVPAVAKKKSLLDRGEGDACDEGQRCVPCTNPLEDGKSTGVCELDHAAAPASERPECATPAPAPSPPPEATPLPCPYVGPPLVDVNNFEACGEGMRCVPTDLVPLSAREALATCPAGLCAPEKSIAAGGNYVPRSCRSIMNGEGRCTNVALAAVGKQKDLLPQGECEAFERCVPCFGFADGKPTGACETAKCDAPKEPPLAIVSCCEKTGVKRGRCLPETAIPKALHERLDDRDCKGKKELCVPADMLSPAFAPAKCTASGAILGDYSGVCLSDCLSYGLGGIAINQGTCPAWERCVPCTRDGKPTDAPGCPAVTP